MRLFYLSLLLFLVNTAVGSSIDNFKLVEFRLYPNNPLVGQNTTVLIIPEKFSGDIELKTIIEATFDGEEISLEYLGQNLWKFSSVILQEAKDYVLITRVSIEDKKQADSLRNEISKLTREVEHLRIKIQLESDEDVRFRLNLEMEGKIADRQDLQDFLPSFRRFIGEEIFKFAVTAGQGF